MTLALCRVRKLVPLRERQEGGNGPDGSAALYCPAPEMEYTGMSARTAIGFPV
jgi:hypothetical protein